MALIKSKTIKGVNAEYWKIIHTDNNFRTGKTTVNLGVYVSEEARQDNVMNYLETENFEFDDVDLTRAEQYAKIKESKIVDEVETNWFADAVDA